MNVEAEIQDLKDALVQLDGVVLTEVKLKNKELRRVWKQVSKLEKRLEYVVSDMWEQELFLVKTDVKLADKIDLMIKVTRRNQNRLEDLFRLQKANDDCVERHQSAGWTVDSNNADPQEVGPDQIKLVFKQP